MAISWGSYNGHLRVGIDISQSPSSVSNSTGSVTLTIEYYIQSDGYAFADNQTLNLSGDKSGSIDFFNDLDGNSKKVGTRTQSVSTSYSSTKTRTYSAKLSGAFNGASPSKTRSWTVPKRPILVPDKVSTPSVDPLSGGQNAQVSWSKPGGNGDSPNKYEVLVETPGGANVDNEESGTDRTQRMEGMTPGNNYTARVRAHNSAGWGPYSDKRSFTTDAVRPSKPTQSSVSNITSTGAIVDHGTADNGGDAIFDWDNRVSPTSNFSSGVISDDAGNFVGKLTPSTKYWAQSRAQNSKGESDWSSAVTFTTLTSAQVKISGTWRTTKVWLKVSGTWRQAKVWKKASGSWQL